MLSPLLRACLFDMDGTIVDSTPVGNRAWGRWADEAGIVDRTFMETFHGRPGLEVLAEILPADQIDTAFARLVDLEANDVEGVEAIAGAEALLSSLDDTQRAIVTSSQPSIVPVRLAAAGLDRPSIVVTADQTARGKPHPDPFLRGASLLGVAPGECAVFEDTPPGIEAARAAGVAFVVGVRGTHPDAALQGADVIVDDLSAVRVEPAAEGAFRLVVSA
ncbi:HAD family hydrolase [Frondihabitans australicus]|uniref:Sugar-phosphatase n=1 Tax=Frondihabitans australicus TaxID=386892 RepID=A0A495IES5_9MICO|nr:HAD-IA family hydrolase [Frondihabitans australicus]RKR73506.1 sugar-phosphatase [Frondihabitans australicus]